MGAQGDGNDLGGMVELYPHDPLTLLPLLESHLPYSLPVYGLIKSSFVSSRTVPDNDITPTTTDVSSNPPSYISSVAWLTFPPSSLPIPPEVWTVIIHLPYPMSRQTRLFNSLEPLLTVLPSSTASSSTIPSDSSSHSPISSTHPSTLPSTQPQFQQWKLGQNQVSNVIRKMTQKNAVMQIVGALSVLWAESVRLEFGTEAHKICDNWMAPDLSHSEKHDVQSGQESHDGKDGQDGKDGSSRIQGARVSKDGLAVDVGRREDCEMVSLSSNLSNSLYTSTPLLTYKCLWPRSWSCGHWLTVCRFNKRGISKKISNITLLVFPIPPSFDLSDLSPTPPPFPPRTRQTPPPPPPPSPGS